MSETSKDEFFVPLNELFGYGGAINKGFEAGARLVDAFTGNYHYPPPQTFTMSRELASEFPSFDPSSRRNMRDYGMYGTQEGIPRRRPPQYGYGIQNSYGDYYRRPEYDDECIGISNPQYGM